MTQLPNRIRILPWGTSQSVHGPVAVGPRTLSVLAENQRARGFEQVALDFEHNTVPGSAEYERTREPRAVAAFGVPRCVEGVGLLLDELVWTPAGKESAGFYPDVSAAVQLDSNQEAVFVHSAAITRHGAVPGAHLVAFSAEGSSLLLSGALLPVSWQRFGLARTRVAFQGQFEEIYREATGQPLTRLAAPAPSTSALRASGLRGVALTARAFQLDYEESLRKL